MQELIRSYQGRAGCFDTPGGSCGQVVMGAMSLSGLTHGESVLGCGKEGSESTGERGHHGAGLGRGGVLSEDQLTA